ncbi:MAG TPA: hypothetical protein VEV44_17120 [Pseudoneobacillus sp.]|nr:hypothetical protein [Pseudoneobacillus sp.]
MNDFSTVLRNLDFSILLEQLLSVLPIAIPVVLVLYGVRKALHHLLSTVKGA